MTAPAGKSMLEHTHVPLRLSQFNVNFLAFRKRRDRSPSDDRREPKRR